MRNLLLTAVAALAISSPALARDGSPYVGVEAGVAMSDEGFYDVEFFDGDTTVEFSNGINVDYKIGVDADLIAGYDFGLVRAEAELGYKRLGIEGIDLSNALLAVVDDVVDDPEDLELDGSAKVTSLMGNVLFDFGGDNGFGAYVGGGAGLARVKLFDDRDSRLAWQLIAGIRTAISPNIDLGLKYRYFNSGKLEFGDEFDDGEGSTFGVDVTGRLKTHSLMASLVYNFYTPPPPPPAAAPAPPPPAPPPATQTCPDGSVVLATETCPVPPPPPPPPPPAPERG